MAEPGADAEQWFPVADESDVVVVRLRVRAIAVEHGLDTRAADALCTALSEIAHNIIAHAGRGEVVISKITRGGLNGIEVVARDEGPGIPSIDAAFEDGFSTAGGLGLGLASARRLVGELEITTAATGTIVTLRSWANAGPVGR